MNPDKPKKTKMKGVLKGFRNRFTSNKGKSPGKVSTKNSSAPKSETTTSPPSQQPAIKKETPSKSLSSNSTGPFTKQDLLEPMVSFRECVATERQSLFIRKLKLCCVMFDFTDESPKENLGKEMKRQILLELVDYISTNKNWFSEPVLVAIIEMVSCNLFRALPPSPNDIFDPEEDDPVLDPAWPHLQIVYEFLLRFVVSTETDTRLLKKYINSQFVLNILELFDSEDPRERDYLKTILHRIYGKFMSLRSFIRKAINNVFYKFIYETERHNGCGELLEILGSIINGFALPLKQEHKRFLRNVLIPLHKVKMLAIFHQQLAYCVTQFIDKDPKLSSMVINGLIKFWPLTSSSKEVLFLNELEEVLELTQTEEFEQVLHHLFMQIARSICSPHFQVAERALFLWNNEYIATLTSDHRHKVLPILYPALQKNSKNHWNATVHSLTFNIIKMFMEMDGDLFEEVSKKYNEEHSEEVSSNERESQWKELEKQYAASS